MNIRSVQSSDYYTLSPLINEWWGGRNMSDKLPKLFFDHFTNTSLIMEKDGEIIGFLIGFYRSPKQMKRLSILLGSILITENRILQKDYMMYSFMW